MKRRWMIFGNTAAESGLG